MEKFVPIVAEGNRKVYWPASIILLFGLQCRILDHISHRCNLKCKFHALSTIFAADGGSPIAASEQLFERTAADSAAARSQLPHHRPRKDSSIDDGCGRLLNYVCGTQMGVSR